MRKGLITLGLVYALGLVFVFYILRTDVPPPDVVVLNDLMQTITHEAYDLDRITASLAYVFETMDTARVTRDAAFRTMVFIIMSLFALAGIFL